MIERREREGSLMKNNPHSLLISRIVTALIIGVLTGCIIVFFFPNEFFGSQSITSNRLLPVVVPKTQENSAESESSDRVNMLKSEFVALLSDKNAELKKQVKELTERLQLAEQGKDQAEKMILALGKQVRELTEGKDQAEKKLLALSKLEKAGPFGTVKALRTNPTVAPDEFLNPRLANLLEKIAVKREIIVTLANSNVKEILEVWFTNIKRVGISNYLVVALDDEIAKFCESSQVPFYQRDPDNGIDTVGKIANGATVSTLKFRILREFLQLGYSVLLSDIDIVYLQNPFDHLYRDSDVESMSDGHNNLTAYGYNDVFDDPGMGWSSGVYTRRIFVYNCGFFYIRPTIPSIELLDRVAARLSKENAWDQVVFNEELFHPSHPGYDGLHAAKRTMDIYLFMNSRVLFKTVRNDANLSKLKPVIIHLNYHRDKLRRMKAIVEYYVNGNQDALKPFPDGTPR